MSISESQNPLSIKKIEVGNLFGHYSYSIPTETDDISNLLILYGDNGSGKTTILELIFWLLSTRENSGYKTRIALIKFQKISIQFENGIEIGAIRENGKLIGSYKFYIHNNEKPLYDLQLEVNTQGAIKIEPDSAEHSIFLEMIKYIKDLNISVFYLSDDRKILNSVTSSHNEEHVKYYKRKSASEMIFSSGNYEKIELKRSLNEKKLSLDSALERLIDWIRTKTISSSRTGEQKSQIIFTELIQNIVGHNNHENEKTKESILKEISTIESNISPYVNLGLIDEFDSAPIIKTIDQAKEGEQLEYLIAIITPHLDSINAKLTALEKLKDTINLFVSSINEYFSNKTISFNLSIGFKLTQYDEEIQFGYLSSGEKQLLLLLINAITASEAATIFIIDEPEISLNIKWQRNLIDTLLKLISNKNIQYLISTHSLELLATNIEQVSKLENINAPNKEKI